MQILNLGMMDGFKNDLEKLSTTKLSQYIPDFPSYFKFFNIYDIVIQ